MADKYYLKEVVNPKQIVVYILYMKREPPKEGAEHIATFYNPSLAAKVCGLLNETSRSQGRHS